MRENKKKLSGFDSYIKNITKVKWMCGGVLFLILNGCSMNYEKTGTILGSVGGVGSGMYMCDGMGSGNFKIGCMVLGGIMGGVLGGELGESFDNKEIYNVVRNDGVGDGRSFVREDGSKMDVKVVDDYVENRNENLLGERVNIRCKDFEFEVEKGGVYERGRGKSCRDNMGDWKVLGIDLIR